MTTDTATGTGTLRGHRFEDIPLDERYCNECSDQIVETEAIGDLWRSDDGEDAGFTLLCRDCA